MSETENPVRHGVVGRVAVVIAAAVLYAYPFWTALGNLLNLPTYFETQFGAADKVPWILLIADVARPVVLFVLALVLVWRRGAGALALVLTTGFAVVNATTLSTLAFEKEIEIRIVIDFLTNGG